AGHETTSTALAWTWYLLASNPEVEKKLHAEVDAILGARCPAITDVPHLKYVEMILAESMRLFPPAWVIGRRAIEDYPIGAFTIPRDSLILMSQWVTHRDP